VRLTHLRKISEFHICQWEGDLDDGNYIYVRIRNDRLAVGHAHERWIAMNHCVNFPYSEKFIERHDLEGPFHTAQLLPHLKQSGIDCSQINPEEVEQSYLDARF
jgi:hypothetical protein